MKHAILGAGAVGGLIATPLASFGEEVTKIVRAEKLAAYPETLTLERPSETITAPARTVSELMEPVDVLWIATRTFQLQTALDSVKATAKMIVPLLNGVDHIAVLRARFGHDSVVPATIAVEVEHPSLGRFIQRSPGVRLNLAAGAEPVLGGIVARLREIGFTCEFIQNEQTLLWSKLCFLAPFALVTAASGKNKGEIDADPQWKAKLVSAIAEASAIAKASGAEIDHAKLHALFHSFPPSARSSMAKDVAAKRPLELDGIAGPILRGGQKYEIDVHTTVELMQKIQSFAVTA